MTVPKRPPPHTTWNLDAFARKRVLRELLPLRPPAASVPSAFAMTGSGVILGTAQHEAVVDAPGQLSCDRAKRALTSVGWTPSIRSHSARAATT